MSEWMWMEVLWRDGWFLGCLMLGRLIWGILDGLGIGMGVRGWLLGIFWTGLGGFGCEVKGHVSCERGLAGWAEKPTPRQGLVIRWLIFTSSRHGIKLEFPSPLF